MRTSATIALALGASAFAPKARPTSDSALAFFGGGAKPAPPSNYNDLGVLPPLGLWDPLGLAEDTAAFPRRRAVEIKHGRISMIAFVGMLVQELGITFPGYIDLGKTTAFADIPTGFAGLTKIPPFGVLQIFIFAGLAETAAAPAGQYTGGPQNLPGGYDGAAGTIPGGYPFTTQVTDPETRKQKLNIEIQNGRAAMLGVFGCMVHSMLDSTDHHFFYPIIHN
jgi:hypothetical protein